MSHSVNVNSNSNISFGNLRQNLKTGEAVLREFKKEFPVLHSNTYLAIRRFQHQDSNKFAKILPKIQKVEQKYNQGVGLTREMTDDVFDEVLSGSSSFGTYVTKLKEVLAFIKYGNCGEYSDIVDFKLINKGENSHNIAMSFKDPKTGKERNYGKHVFTVFGFKEGAQLTNPKTWGQDAVVVDAWANIVMRSNDAIEYFKTMFCFNPANSKIDYEVADLVKEPESPNYVSIFFSNMVKSIMKHFVKEEKVLNAIPEEGTNKILQNSWT